MSFCSGGTCVSHVTSSQGTFLSHAAHACTHLRCNMLSSPCRHAFPALLVASLLLAACSAQRKPSILVESATIEPSTSATDANTRTVLVRLLARNTTDQPIPLREARYELKAGNYSSGAYTRDAQRTVPRFGAQVVTLPVPVPADVAEQIERGGQWTLEGDMGYLPYAAWRRTLYESRVIIPRVPIEASIP